jgi:hypothetical protein
MNKSDNPFRYFYSSPEVIRIVVRFLAPEVILTRRSGGHLYLDQLETKARCKRGAMDRCG